MAGLVALALALLARGPRLGAPSRPLRTGPGAWAGHNRWSKVRTIKGPRDAARSRLFQRLATLLRCAVREGGPDPSLNPQLASVLEQCRARNVPRATIQAAIHGSERNPLASTRLLLEARGAGGWSLLVEVLTDSPRRCQNDLRLLLRRRGGALAEGVRHGFEEQGVVRVGPPLTLEAALEAAAEAGAQDVSRDDGEEGEEEPVIKFICQPSALWEVHRRLEASGLRPLSAALEYQPLCRVLLPPESQEQAELLLQELGDYPEVLRLFHNIQDPDPNPDP